MNKEIDYEKIKHAVRDIIEALGDDPQREGLIETPDRVARMYGEIFEGMRYTNDEIAQMFDKCFETEKKPRSGACKGYRVLQLLRAPSCAYVQYEMPCRLYPQRTCYRAFKNRTHMRYGLQKTSASGKNLRRYSVYYPKGLQNRGRYRYCRGRAQLYDRKRYQGARRKNAHKRNKRIIRQ